MHVTIFGATGNVGRHAVTEALHRGHQVTAVVRDPGRAHLVPAGAATAVGDAAVEEDVLAASADADVVIGALRAPAGREAELVPLTERLLAGVAKAGTRLLLVGGAGSLRVPGAGGTTVIDHPDHMDPAYRDIATANIGQLEACFAQPELDWTYLSPAASLQPGERTGRYRVGRDELVVDADGRSRISFADLAVALLDEAERPAHHRERFTVAY